MFEARSFEGIRLRGGFFIVGIEYVEEPMTDALGRSAIAKTEIIGRELRLTILSGQSDKEMSVTVYHEILEAMTLAVAEPPESVQEFNEGDFERAGYESHNHLGPASPGTLNAMLQSYGFREE